MQTPDDSMKIVVLGRMAEYYSGWINDNMKADSVCELALKLASRHNNLVLKIMAFNLFVETIDPENFSQKTTEYIEEASRLCRLVPSPQLRWRTFNNRAVVYSGMVKPDLSKAISSCRDAISFAHDNRRKDWIIMSYLTLGNCLEGLNLKLEALRYYFYAADLAESNFWDLLLKKCYSSISYLYRSNAMYEKALDYKRRQIELVRHQGLKDSTEYMWLVFDTISIYSKSKCIVIKESVIDLMVGYADRTRNLRMKQYVFALYRTYLLETDRISDLYNLYNVHYPEEWKTMKEKDIGMYCRMKAYFSEYKGMPDSALIYFRLAEDQVMKSRNLFLQSNFFYRFGQFCERQQLNEMAISRFRLSYEIACKANASTNLIYMLPPARRLEQLYRNRGDFRNAYFFSVQVRTHSDNLQAIAKKDQVLMLDLTNAQQKRDIENLRAKQRDEQIIRKRKTERNMTAAGALFIVVIAWFIYRNYRNQKHLNRLLDAEKQKSDQLLLNILPNETAEELKLYGEARARRFDEVTVMFTDFKDFTITSERMEAEDLVRIIHRYFSEFDRIISRHNLEKIKIIGDSYMCAGGLPVPNTTHAVDMVRAALELQAFMAAERGRAREADEPAFELRVGIHTGPVVAGIVGLNKFAYDIWGDTVNTASRMESSGEVNRVNISGRTWELVSKRYRCTYRGKVKAKNKGEIDMYFVEGEQA